MDMIEYLYRGNICEESITPKSDRYSAARKKMYAYSDLLESQLSQEQQKMLDEYLSVQAAVLDLEHLEFFRQGMIIGAKLMLEIGES